jgi:hypothetical protein
MSRQIELNIGKDLQFIRINGTLVGGTIGLLLWLFSQIPLLLHLKIGLMYNESLTLHGITTLLHKEWRRLFSGATRCCNG